MADVTTATLLSRLRTLLRDSGDTTYSLVEKNEALRQAIEDDPFVFRIARDEDTTIATGVNSYELADGFEDLLQLLIDVGDDGFPIPLNPAGYEVIDGTIWLRRNNRHLPDGKALVQIGKKKLKFGDNLPPYLVGYVLHTAAAYLLELLVSDKTGRFLKNDTSMSEIMGAISNHRQVAARYQRTLPNRNSVVF